MCLALPNPQLSWISSPIRRRASARPAPASAALSAAGHPAKKTSGLVTATMSGTRSILEAYARRVFTSGLRPNVYRAAVGRRIRIGMHSDLLMAAWRSRVRFETEKSCRRPSLSRRRPERAHERQQTPYRCQSRNHGLCACMSSCLRFAAARSLGLSGLVSGTATMRSSHSISAMVCSASIRHNIKHKGGEVKRSQCIVLCCSTGASARLLDSTHLHRKHGDRAAVHALNRERDRLRRRAGAEDV